MRHHGAMDPVFDVDAAIVLPPSAHAGQRDKGRPTVPYITHPLRVMVAFDDPELQQIAVLHDVVEDTRVTLEDLVAAGASPLGAHHGNRSLGRGGQEAGHAVSEFGGCHVIGVGPELRVAQAAVD